MYHLRQMHIGQAIQNRGRTTLVALAATLAVFGCAGRPSVKEQYVKHTREITEKYDGLLLTAKAPLYGSKTPSCSEFIEVLTKKYSYWKPGETGTNFCQSDAQSSSAERRKFEMHARGMHNKGVLISKTKRLARLAQLYKEAAKVDGGDEAVPTVVAGPAPGRSKRLQRPKEVRQEQRFSQRRVSAPSVKTEALKDPTAPGKDGDLLPYAEDADEPVKAAAPARAAVPARAVAPAKVAAPAPSEIEVLEPEPVVPPDSPAGGDEPAKDTPMSEYQD